MPMACRSSQARDQTYATEVTTLDPFFFLSFCLFAFSRATPAAYGGSQARGPIGVIATSLRHSHSNAGSELRLQPTPQLTATLDP